MPTVDSADAISTHRANVSESGGIPQAAPLAAYPDLLTVDDMAEILDATPRTIYRLSSAGELPKVRVGRRLYFPKRLVIEALRLGEG